MLIPAQLNHHPHTETASEIATRSVSSLTGPKWAPYRFQLGSSLISAVEKNKRQQAACERIPITSIAVRSSAEVKAPTQHTTRTGEVGPPCMPAPNIPTPTPPTEPKFGRSWTREGFGRWLHGNHGWYGWHHNVRVHGYPVPTSKYGLCVSRLVTRDRQTGHEKISDEMSCLPNQSVGGRMHFPVRCVQVQQWQQ
jgi:hypothetical protein